MAPTIVVVPCYNEAERLDASAIVGWLAQNGDVRFVFVNDGSTDRTPEVLASMQKQLPRQVDVVDLETNRGKAEAVRLGLLRAIALGGTIIGYFDADLATPLGELSRLIGIMATSGARILLASRVALLGRHIERTHLRHYLGRVFATMASVTLQLHVYDTQCGAKLLRPTPALEAALREPFLSRWAFDVELLGRLLNPPPGVASLVQSDLIEEPLLEWRDIPGSKLKLAHMVSSAADLLSIAMELRRARAKLRHS